MSKSCCGTCQRYMKTKALGLVLASIPAQKIGKKDTEAQARHDAAQQQALAAAATAQLERICEVANASDVEGPSTHREPAPLLTRCTTGRDSTRCLGPTSGFGGSCRQAE